MQIQLMRTSTGANCKLFLFLLFFHLILPTIGRFFLYFFFSQAVNIERMLNSKMNLIMFDRPYALDGGGKTMKLWSKSL